MLDRQQTLQRHEELRTERQKREGRWRELAMLFRPDEADFEASNDSDRDDSELFDSVTLQAVESFVGGMFNQGCNPATSWFGVTLDDRDRARFKPVKDWLHRRTQVLYASLAPAASMFYTEMPSVLACQAVFGNGYLAQEEIVGENFIADRAPAFGECYIEFDHASRLHTFNRELMLKGRHARQKYPTMPATVRDDQTIKIVHSVYRNPGVVPGRLGPQGMAFASCAVSPDVREFIHEGGFYEQPYHVFQWSRRSSSPYANGPGHTARPDAATNNEAERSYLVAEQFAAEPPILVADESAFSAADIVPNAVLEGAYENGKPNMGVLERKQKLEFSLSRSEKRRDAIRAAFLFSMMQLASRPQMTATEFLGFQEEFLKQMAPNLVRMQTGGLASFIARRYRILDRAGAFADDPPPPEAQGRLEIEFVSPLDKLQQVGKARGALQWVTAVGQVATLTGDRAPLDNIDGDAMATMLHDAFTEEPSVLRDPRQVAEIRRQRNAQMEQAAQLEQTGQAVTIAAEASHAQQAASLAQKRSATR